MVLVELTPAQLAALDRAERALARLRWAVDKFCRSREIRIPIIRRGRGTMLAEFKARNQLKDGKPHGGYARGKGMDISWQKGPLGRGADRKEPNGAFVETVIAAARQRLQFYQDNGFDCSENASAIQALDTALAVLDRRTRQREGAGVEGTHERRP